MRNIIGDTPLIKINYKYKGTYNSIFTKLEYYNLTGSIKDRLIDYIIKKAIKDGSLKSDMPLVEATSGNTGISLAAIGAYYGHHVHIFMPNWASMERVEIMKLYGAEITLVSKEEGGFKKCIELANEYKIKNNGFSPNQFKNTDNIDAHYYGIGSELNKIKIDAFISGIGTGGTLMGIGKRLQEQNASIYALEPKEMSLIKEHNVGMHKIEGIGDDFIPDIVDLDMIKDVLLIESNDAINMSKSLASLGLGVGISSGANMIGAILLKEMGYNNVATIFPDDFKKYLTTDLTKDIDIKDKYISSKVELLSYEVI